MMHDRMASARPTGAGLYLLVFLCVTLSAGVLRAQAPTTSVPSDSVEFEVASIRSNRTADGRVAFETPPGRFRASAPLRFIIRQAYRLPDAGIIGGPDWLSTDRYDIVATAPAGPSTAERIRQMVRAL